MGWGRTGTREEKRKNRKGKNRKKTNGISHDFFEQGNILLVPIVLHSPMSSDIDIHLTFSMKMISSSLLHIIISTSHVSCGIEMEDPSLCLTGIGYQYIQEAYEETDEIWCW